MKQLPSEVVVNTNTLGSFIHRLDKDTRLIIVWCSQEGAVSCEPVGLLLSSALSLSFSFSTVHSPLAVEFHVDVGDGFGFWCAFFPRPLKTCYGNFGLANGLDQNSKKIRPPGPNLSPVAIHIPWEGCKNKTRIRTIFSIGGPFLPETLVRENQYSNENFGPSDQHFRDQNSSDRLICPLKLLRRLSSAHGSHPQLGRRLPGPPPYCCS